MLVTTIALYEAPTSINTGSTDYAQYGPVPLSLASEMVFPAIYYLMKIGKNDAHITGF